MSDERCVIIGGSHAAASLAPQLRQSGWEGTITIVSAEDALPYHRPPLSKTLLDGSAEFDDIQIRAREFYEKHRIDLILGVAVTAIDREKKRVALADGAVLPYTKLALTTGAKVRKIDLPGVALPGVHYLRDIKDVRAIKTRVREGDAAVIIGGGYIGLETAASLCKAGMKVTVVEAMPRVLQRVTNEEVSEFYTRVHREEGVEVKPNSSVQAIEGDSRVKSVSLGCGESIKADLVIIGVGVDPETSLAEAAGLEVSNGVVVNRYAQTSDPDIVAAGDCTYHHNPIYDCRLRLESVQNANDQAKVAARTICNSKQAYNSLPWFWSDQFDIKLQIAGLSTGFDKVTIRGSTSSGRSFAAFYFKAGKFIAVDAVNRPKEYMLGRKALTSGQGVNADRLADESIPVSEAFVV